MLRIEQTLVQIRIETLRTGRDTARRNTLDEALAPLSTSAQRHAAAAAVPGGLRDSDDDRRHRT
jgi:hypothetical protein